jgi:hypothetical protein
MICNCRNSEVYVNFAIFMIAVLIFPLSLILATFFNQYYSIILGIGVALDFIFFFSWYVHWNIVPKEHKFETISTDSQV